MKRREFLKSATLVAGANATAAFATSTQNQRDATKGKPIGKIALEEHFMVPDFVEYFRGDIPEYQPGDCEDGAGNPARFW